MIAFYTPAYNTFEQEDEVTLNAEESWHAAKVLRVKEGESVILLNGKGWLAHANIVVVHEKHTRVKVSTADFKSLQSNILTIGISVLKTNERMEWMLEKLVELGVGQVSFINCKRTERNKINLERLQKIAVATLKQCKRYWLPLIDGVVDFDKYISNEFSGDRYIAYCEAKDVMAVNFSHQAHVLIGPEGDFTDDEIQKASSKGFKPVLISNQILRSETAAIALAAAWDLKI